jgi:hypothetical protein
LTTSRLAEPFKEHECCAHSSDVLRFADEREEEIAIDEEKFNALIQPRPFGTEDAKRVDLQLRRKTSLESRSRVHPGAAAHLSCNAIRGVILLVKAFALELGRSFVR